MLYFIKEAIIYIRISLQRQTREAMKRAQLELTMAPNPALADKLGGTLATAVDDGDTTQMELSSMPPLEQS